MKSRQCGMTLIELILVMGLLATVLAISSPVLSGFVKGRKLREEARRFLALTRYGRSEAISRGVCMEMRIDTETGKYGLYRQVEYGSGARPPVEFQLSEGLSFELDENVAVAQDASGKTSAKASLRAAFDAKMEGAQAAGAKTEARESVIRFWPDGMIDEESPENLRIAGEEEETLTIHRVDIFSGYAIEDEEKNV